MTTTSQQLTTADIHAHFPFFTEADLQQTLAEQGVVHHFPAGTVIMDFGGYVRMLPLVLKGSIKISRLGAEGEELFLYYLGPGESCTMTFACCRHEKRSEIRAVAEEDTAILGLPHLKLDEWMMRYPSWKNFVMRSYDARMTELIQTIDQVSFQQLDKRLVSYLRDRARLYPEGVIPTTHQQIAKDLNASREAVSRLLKGLEQRGQLQLERGRVIWK